MKLEVNVHSILVSALIGGFIGVWGGPVSILIPWTIVALAVGALNKTRKSSIINGAAYGFTIAYVFMLSIYNGAASIYTRLLPFIIFGVIGAVFGLVLAFIGFVIFHFNKKTEPK